MIVDVVTLACVTICRRPPNKKWIFGYGKIETVVHLPLAILSSSGWCAHGHSWSRVRTRLRAVHGDDPHGTSRNSGCSVASDGDGSHHSREQPQVQPAAEWNRRRHGRQHYFDQVLDLRGCLVGWFSCSGRIDLSRNTTATCSTQMPCTIEQMRSLPL